MLGSEEYYEDMSGQGLSQLTSPNTRKGAKGDSQEHLTQLLNMTR